jgi:hypothetical protein
MKNLQILLVKQNTLKAFFHIPIVFYDFKQHHVNEYSMFKTMSRIEVGSNWKWSYQDYALSNTWIVFIP